MKLKSYSSLPNSDQYVFLFNLKFLTSEPGMPHSSLLADVKT